MMPIKCSNCKKPAGLLYDMKKNGKKKRGLCLVCKEKLEKEGWKVIGQALL